MKEVTKEEKESLLEMKIKELEEKKIKNWIWQQAEANRKSER